MKNSGWYSLQQLLKAIIPTLYGAFRSCSVVLPYNVTGFSGLRTLHFFFPWEEKNPNSLQE